LISPSKIERPIPKPTITNSRNVDEPVLEDNEIVIDESEKQLDVVDVRVPPSQNERPTTPPPPTIASSHNTNERVHQNNEVVIDLTFSPVPDEAPVIQNADSGSGPAAAKAKQATTRLVVIDEVEKAGHGKRSSSIDDTGNESVGASTDDGSTQVANV
jgi:hypothetical protein